MGGEYRARPSSGGLYSSTRNERTRPTVPVRCDVHVGRAMLCAGGLPGIIYIYHIIVQVLLRGCAPGCIIIIIIVIIYKTYERDKRSGLTTDAVTNANGSRAYYHRV